jgi:hypothetical protein
MANKSLQTVIVKKANKLCRRRSSTVPLASLIRVGLAKIGHLATLDVAVDRTLSKIQCEQAQHISIGAADMYEPFECRDIAYETLTPT